MGPFNRERSVAIPYVRIALRQAMYSQRNGEKDVRRRHCVVAALVCEHRFLRKGLPHYAGAPFAMTRGALTSVGHDGALPSR